MIIQQIRNAAVKMKYSGMVFLTDPWLQRKGTGPSLEACRPMEKRSQCRSGSGGPVCGCLYTQYAAE